MRRKTILAIVALLSFGVALTMNEGVVRPVQAQDAKSDSLDVVKKHIAASKVAAEIKNGIATANTPTYGKVYYLWPMSDGTLLFGILTSTGNGYAFTIKTGDLTAEAMVKVLLTSYEKQTPVYIFADPSKPQVATAVVTITL